MKKLVYSILLTAIVSLAGCDLDRESPNTLPYGKAFESILSIQSLERGAYSCLRTAYSPQSMIVPDLQCDYVHPVFGFSNTYGAVYLWAFTQDDRDIESVWNGFYKVISQCNFTLEGLEDRSLLRFEPTGSEITTLNRIQGRMYLMRALSYSVLAERFCEDYNEATARKEHSGLPLMTKHTPDAKLGRASLYDIYDQILNDLTEAKTLLTGVTGASNSTVLNLDCLTALEARVYLQMDNYEMALKKANLLIGNTNYSLVNSQAELQEMWTNEKSAETIFQFFATKTELAYQFGISFYKDYFSGMQTRLTMTPDYIPTQACVDSYDDKDWRKAVYFLNCKTELNNLTSPQAMIKGYVAFAQRLTIISKYPGNPDLRTSAQWNYYNTFKVFRLAEMYLIAAEAAAREGGDAKTPLNILRKQRGLAALDAVTLADVQTERYREMMLEGTRLTDLKRWGLGMTRGTEQKGYVIDEAGIYNDWTYIVELQKNLSATKDNYMFLWPIPTSEISSNPQIANQQNPGWQR